MSETEKYTITLTLAQLARLMGDVERSKERYEAMLRERHADAEANPGEVDPAITADLERMIADRIELFDLLKQAGRWPILVQAEETRAPDWFGGD